MMRARPVGVALIGASAALFGTTPILGRIAYAAGTDTYTLLFLRFAIASAVLLPIVVLRRVALPPRDILIKLTLLGGIGRVGQTLTYFVGLTFTTASLMSLLLYLYPALVALLAAVFLRDRLTPLKSGAIVLALAGTTLTASPALRATSLGVALGVGTAVIYAVYILLSSRVTPRAGAMMSSAIITVAAALVFGVLTAVHGAHPPQTSGGWLAVLAIALVSTVLGTLAFFAGMERIGPTDTSTLSTLEPIVTVTLAVLFLGERIAIAQVFGGALILAAVLLLTRGTKPAQPLDTLAEP